MVMNGANMTEDLKGNMTSYMYAREWKDVCSTLEPARIRKSWAEEGSRYIYFFSTSAMLLEVSRSPVFESVIPGVVKVPPAEVSWPRAYCPPCPYHAMP